MAVVKRLYFSFFVLVYMLYALFNKGIAYSYLSEAIIVSGLLLVLWNLRSYEFAWDRRMALLFFFMFMSILYIGRGVMEGYGITDVVRDSVIFNYIAFAFIVYFLKDELPFLKQQLFTIYKWYPVCMCCFFLLSSYSPFLRELTIFGGQRIFLYKFGDMGVHLFIATIFLLNGNIVLSRRYLVLQWVIIAYLFLVVSSYSRSGMISFIIPMGVFFILTKNMVIKRQMIKLLKFAPFIVILALPLFLSTNLEENFQGRSLSIEQLKNNAVSIFSSEDDGTTLSDNKVWRLVWWGRIVEYTFLGEYFFHGRGLGMSLAATDDIDYDPTEGNLRSPHSFHMTVLARFGVPVFLLWLYWMYLHISKIRRKELSAFMLILLSVSLSFLINASFDVFLEGPMGAMPFWIFVGLAYAEEAFNSSANINTA
ncbi:O-antigen ligase family protein [Sediminibacterium sp.]|uniref:O-antigen ligase family protein n=1 Tax=Sediminibacterium sp. TaxID=1917865 RepID=UPI0025E96D2D|nr:O-antigen ligase family protein [Sediminibacterium sp.]MBW0177703.1 O-antigen ligase family protein [Sediminibacterium sp.]